MRKVVDIAGLIIRVLLIAFIFVAIQIALLSVFRLMGIDMEIYEGSFSFVYGICTILIFAVYDLIRSYKREPLIKKAAPNAVNTVAAIVLGFGLLGIVTLYMYLMVSLSNMSAAVSDALEKYSDNIDRFSSVDKAKVPYWDVIIDFLATTFIIPLAEEMTFRGALFGELRRYIKPLPAALLSALVFGLMHGLSVHIGYAVICGVVLALVYYYSRSVWVSYIVHAVFNFMGSSLFSLLDSGIFGDLSRASADASFHTSVFEIICILPAVCSFIILRLIFKEHERLKKEGGMEVM